MTTIFMPYVTVLRHIDVRAVMAMEEGVKRRVRAGRMLQAGKKPAKIAVAVGVARQTVYTWKRILEESGIEALREIDRGGRPGSLDEEQFEQIRRALLESPTAHGFGTELWTIKRVRVLIERLHGVTSAKCTCGAFSGGWGSPARSPRAARAGAQRGGHHALEEARLAAP